MKRLLTFALLAACGALAHGDVITLNAIADCRILNSEPNTNDNGDLLSTYTVNGAEQRTVIMFDYSSLVGQNIVSADLMLYGASYFGATSPTTIDLYRVASPWSETQVTWNSRDTGDAWVNAGGDALGTTGQQLTNPFTHWSGNGTINGTWFNFDATSLVQGALSGQFTNNGIMLVGAQGGELSWVSREGNSFNGFPAANVPELVVTTAAPEPGLCITLGTLVALAIRRRQTAG
ncbi:MAG TPA: DNRLRE domain-containing protein [Fimbriimonadaceae bacterium]|nr:DNRLRE domain-containing protein [Fimbriimonadaceae bacterium]